MMYRSCNAVLFLLLVISVSKVPAQAQKTETREAQKKQVTVLKYVVPRYPAIAKTARIGGDVTLKFNVEKDGTVSNVQVVSGPPMLVQTCLDAIKQWKFQCLSCGYGKPFEHQFVFSFGFSYKLAENDHTIEYDLPDKLTLKVGPVSLNPDDSQIASSNQR